MITSRQVLAGRIFLRMQQQELALAADVGLSALARIEQDRANPRPRTLQAIQSALERGNKVGRIEFILPSDGKLEGVRLLPPVADPPIA